MHKARAFFFVCAGLFLLALAYHLGARSAGAQAPGNPVVGAFSTTSAVVTANGDVYYSKTGFTGPYQLVANVFAGGATPAPEKVKQ